MVAQAPEEYFVTDDGPLQNLKVVERQGLSGVEVHLVDSVAEAEEMMRWLGERRNALAVDTETTGLSFKRDKLRLIQIGDTRHGWAIPVDRWLGAAEEALTKYEGSLVFHNCAFDIKFFLEHTKWKPPIDRIHDTMIAAHILQPNRPVGLKPLSVALVDRRANAGELLLKEAMAKQGWDWDTVPIDYGPYWQYGALDTVLTAYLYDIVAIPAQTQYPAVYELEMAVRHVLTEMEWNGTRIDVEYCERKLDELASYVEQTKEWGRETFNGANIGSAPQLVKIFEDMGAEITRTTKSGAKSCDKYMLALLEHEGFELARTILNMRKADKLCSSYFSNFLRNQIDGLVHPSIRSLGARTGRMSVVDPAAQTLNKNESTVRRAFIPRNEGEVIVTADYAQIEGRLLASKSQDQGLIDAFKEADSGGRDFFTRVAHEIYHDPSITKADKRRQLTKNVVYAKLYGAGIEKMAQTAGVPYDVMEPVVKGFESTYPGVLTFQKFVEQIANERLLETGEPFVLTALGRRLPANSDRIYALVNYAIQGEAAEILKQAIINLDLAGLSSMMLLPVHDEIVFSVPKDQVNDVIPVIRENMSVTEDRYIVPIPAEPEGPYSSWGEKYDN